MSLPPGTVVLQVVPRLESGGVERGTVEMVQAIAAAGGVALVASEGGSMLRAIMRAGGRHHGLPLASKNPVRIWRNAAGLARLIREARVDIVHARSRAPAWSALLAARRTRTHFVTTYHAPYDEGRPGKRAYNSVMARGERVIAISAFIARLITERHGTDPSRIRTIPRGVDPAVFDPEAVSPARVAKLAEAWRLPDGGRTVMLPARLSRWKGQDVLIEAMARLSDQQVSCVLVGPLEGRQAYARRLERRARRLGVADRLRFAGACTDMPAALMLADVVVNASTEPEGFGRTVIEAQAMRRPVVASDHGGAAETVADGVTGWRVAPGDPDALAAAIERALSLSESERAWLGDQARQAVLAHYTSAAMQAATLDVYAELLS